MGGIILVALKFLFKNFGAVDLISLLTSPATQMLKEAEFGGEKANSWGQK
jgi:hypothetical protein